MAIQQKSKRPEVLIDLPVKLRELTDSAITIAMAKSGGNKVQAAQMLNISERTLFREIARRQKDFDCNLKGGE